MTSPVAALVATIGVHSRTMSDGTSEIRQYRMLADGVEVAASYAEDLPVGDAKALWQQSYDFVPGRMYQAKIAAGAFADLAGNAIPELTVTWLTALHRADYRGSFVAAMLSKAYNPLADWAVATVTERARAHSYYSSKKTFATVLAVHFFVCQGCFKHLLVP